MYSQMIEYRSKKRFADVDDTSYLDILDTKELLQRNDELLRRLTGARDELKKFKAGLDLFRPWMDNAQKKLIEKEKYLTNFDKIDKCFESTTVFVSDVIDHQTDLTSITNMAKNFIDQFKSYLRYSKEYRTLPARKRARIESISTMEDELTDMVAAITSEYRELLLRVHGLLSNELSGLSVKQKKYKEAVNVAGSWLKGAERRCNEILSESVATDAGALENQLSRILAVNDEFVSKGSLLSDAKKALKTLLKSLEGQLSPDEMADVKNPIIDIEKKYDRLLKALKKRCQTLDTVLVGLKSQQVKDTPKNLHTKSAVSIDEQSAEFAQNDMEQDISDEVEKSINGQLVESNTECTSLNTSRSKEVSPESKTTNCGKTDIESSAEGRNDELEEGECVSTVEVHPKGLKEKIDSRSETPVNESSRESSAISNFLMDAEEVSEESFIEDKNDQEEEINAIPEILNESLFKVTEEISEDSFAEDKNDEEEEINTIPEIRANEDAAATSPERTLLKSTEKISEDSFAEDKNDEEEEINKIPEIRASEDAAATSPERTLSKGTEKIFEDNFSDGKNATEEENSIMPETPTNVQNTTLVPELSSLAADDDVLRKLLELKKNASSNKVIWEKTDVESITDSECFSFNNENEMLEDDLPVVDSNPATETLTGAPKILAYAEYNSFESLNESIRDNSQADKNNLKEQADITPETSNSEVILAVAVSPENTSLEVSNEFSKNRLDEEVSPIPETTPSEQKVSSSPKCTSSEASDEFPRDESDEIDPRSKSETLANEEKAPSSPEHTPLEATDEFSKDGSNGEISPIPQTATSEPKIASSPEHLSLEVADGKLLTDCSNGEISSIPQTATSEQKIASSPEHPSLEVADVVECSQNDSKEIDQRLESELSTNVQNVVCDVEPTTSEAANEFPQNDSEEKSSSRPVTPSTAHTSNIESNIECASLNVTDIALGNALAEAMDEFSQNDSEKKSSSRPVTPSTEHTSKIESNIECASLNVTDIALGNTLAEAMDELLEDILMENESSTRPVTPTSERNMEWSLSEAAENGSENTSAEAMDVSSSNNLEEESSLRPVIPTSERNMECTSLEVTNIASVNTFADALEDLAKQIAESKKMMDVSFKVKTSMVQSQPESSVIRQETRVSEKSEELASSSQSEALDSADQSREVSFESSFAEDAVPSSQSKVNNSTEQSAEDLSESSQFADTASIAQSDATDDTKQSEGNRSEVSLFADTTSSSQSQPTDCTGESEDFSEPNTAASRVVDNVWEEEQLLMRQPAIFLYDIGKALMQETTRQRAESSGKYNLRAPKTNELHFSTYTKDFITKAETLSRKKKPFKVDLKKHPVSLLQEYCSYYGFKLPQYRIEKTLRSGTKQFFVTSVTVKDKKYTTNVVPLIKKKESKMEAARLCLQDLGILP